MEKRQRSLNQSQKLARRLLNNDRDDHSLPAGKKCLVIYLLTLVLLRSKDSVLREEAWPGNL